MVNRRAFLANSVPAMVALGASWTALSDQTVHAGPKATPPRIKIGQIGVGHAHASKLSVYRESADYEVVGIVEPDPALREQAQAAPVYRDLPWMTAEQLLNVSGLQAVLVETRVRDLLPTAELCVAAGKHIHLDKPAGDDLPHFRRILQLAEQQQLLIQLGYMYRYNHGIILLRDLLKRDWLGEVFEVHTTMSKVVGPESRRELAEYRGGIMFELGCHVIDLVVGLLGRPQRVTPYHQEVSDRQDGLRDNMLAVLEYPKALATVKSTALEVEGFARRHLAVCGTHGTFHLQPLDDPIARVALDRPRTGYASHYQDVTLPKFTRYVADAADMAAVLRSEKTFDFSYEHDDAVQETVLRASGVLSS